MPALQAVARGDHREEPRNRESAKLRDRLGETVKPVRADRVGYAERGVIDARGKGCRPVEGRDGEEVERVTGCHEHSHHGREFQAELARRQARPGKTQLRTEEPVDGHYDRHPDAPQGSDQPRLPRIALLLLVEPDDELSALFGLAEPANQVDDHDDRADRPTEDQDTPLGPLDHRLDVVREDVAEHAEECRPEAGADDVVRHEAPVGHIRRAGDERCEGPHEANEAADQDRLAAVLVHVALNLLEPRFGDLQACAVLDHELAAESAAEPEAHRIAHEGGKPDEADQETDVDLALAGDNASDDHGCFARSDQSDKGPGFQERQNRDEQVRPLPERSRDVLKDLFGLGQPGECAPRVESETDDADDRDHLLFSAELAGAHLQHGDQEPDPRRQRGGDLDAVHCHWDAQLPASSTVCGVAKAASTGTAAWARWPAEISSKAASSAARWPLKTPKLVGPEPVKAEASAP